MTDMDFVKLGKRVLQEEAAALVNASTLIEKSNFHDATSTILRSSGHVIVIGIGKSGHIGRKISASLSSTGTPSFFVHPSEAKHGDLGSIRREDVVILISYSGTSEEVVSLMPHIKNKGAITIALTGNTESLLARSADLVISTKIEKEACPYNLAPTVSTCVVLGIGDALSMALMQARRFSTESFLENHPAGEIGKTLSLKRPLI
ncbi:KpsF/GutQ family sugar-phosphate isomerase [Alloalcanivorax xenomutans]|uniref:KpsF/GutQ family sugar-phosphate isomerase n=1 Tax=Alloalcanivorax xenomutans TaxID=1094342 RepID=UPI00193C3801|nr:SIS domain-containing protein [Alloalcanivorax xenomutans]MBM1145872.1 SIS domain-containing protein [Alcanivorax sp. ZXX171]